MRGAPGAGLRIIAPRTFSGALAWRCLLSGGSRPAPPQEPAASWQCRAKAIPVPNGSTPD